MRYGYSDAANNGRRVANSQGYLDTASHAARKIDVLLLMKLALRAGG